MPYLIRTTDKPNHQQVRAQFESAHRAYLDANKEMILAAGALLHDDGSEVGGGIYIIDVSDRAAAEKFIAEDPFTHADLFDQIEIFGWRKAFFNFTNFLPQTSDVASK